MLRKGREGDALMKAENENETETENGTYVHI